MPEVSFGNLFIIAVIAVLAPLLIGYVPQLRIPSVVLEIIAGVVVGPSLLDWAEVDLPVQVLSVIGLAFLLFLAGLEIDLHRLRGRVLRGALVGYIVSIALGLVIGAALAGVDWAASPTFIAITLSATALGLVVPVLKDAGLADGDVGQTIIAAAMVADFAAIVLLTLFFSASGVSTGGKLLSLAVFAGLVVVAVLLLTRAGRSMHLGNVILRLQDTTAEIRVRLAVVLLLAFVALAERFGLETILGAFLAGAVISLINRDSSSHPHFRVKLEAIGYGFLVPVFFVASGVRLDLKGLFEEPSALLRVPLFLLALLVIRGVPAAVCPLSRSRAGNGGRAATGDVPAVHRYRCRDRRRGRGDLVGDGSRDRVRRSAVGPDLPGRCVATATQGRWGTAACVGTRGPGPSGPM